MKIRVFLILFFYCSTLCIPTQSQAILPLLAVPAVQIGATIMTVVAAGAVAQTLVAVNKSGAYTRPDNTYLMAPVYLYNNVMRAGAQVALGYASSVPYDVKGAYEQGLFASEPVIMDVINTTFPPASAEYDPYPAIPWVNGMGWVCSTGPLPSLGIYSDPVVVDQQVKLIASSYIDTYQPDSDCSGGYAGRVRGCQVRTIPSGPPPPPPSGAPTVLTIPQLEALTAALNAGAVNPNTKDALDRVLVGNPGLVKTVPQAISPAEIAAAQSADAASKSATAATAAATLATDMAAKSAASPNDVALQIAAAQAAAQKAALDLKISIQDQQKARDESYSPPSAGAFATPMTTDAFNIPSRFSLFLNRVKATPIFNFSQSFFNGIPGGGSPLYTVNGGQLFGTHTINMADTFGSGLAVLRAVLLLCFGFYSIRTIILKR